LALARSGEANPGFGTRGVVGARGAALKAKIALETLREQSTVTGLSQRY